MRAKRRHVPKASKKRQRGLHRDPIGPPVRSFSFLPTAQAQHRSASVAGVILEPSEPACLHSGSEPGADASGASQRASVEARARQAALWLVTIHVIQHAAAVPSVTSTRAQGEACALLQTLAQRRPHQRPASRYHPRPARRARGRVRSRRSSCWSSRSPGRGRP